MCSPWYHPDDGIAMKDYLESDDIHKGCCCEFLMLKFDEEVDFGDFHACVDELPRALRILRVCQIALVRNSVYYEKYQDIKTRVIEERDKYGALVKKLLEIVY